MSVPCFLTLATLIPALNLALTSVLYLVVSKLEIKKKLILSI